MLSGDVELNPGFASILNNIEVSTNANTIVNRSNLNSVFHDRLAQLGLQTLDVGGGGDCFFKSVSHQLYGDAGYNAFLRQETLQFVP